MTKDSQVAELGRVSAWNHESHCQTPMGWPNFKPVHTVDYKEEGVNELTFFFRRKFELQRRFSKPCMGLRCSYRRYRSDISVNVRNIKITLRVAKTSKQFEGFKMHFLVNSTAVFLNPWDLECNKVKIWVVLKNTVSFIVLFLNQCQGPLDTSFHPYLEKGGCAENSSHS